MKNYKALFLTFCMFLSISNSVVLAKGFTPKTSYNIENDIEVLASELAKNEDFLDLFSAMFDMIQTFNFSAFDNAKSALNKEQRLERLSNISKQENGDQKELSELIGYQSEKEFSAILNIRNQAAKNLAKSTIELKMKTLSEDERMMVYQKAMEIAATQNYFETSSDKVIAAKAGCTTGCTTDLTKCGVPRWKRGIFGACIAAGVTVSAGGGVLLSAATLGTASIAAIAAAIAFMDSVALWCSDELLVSNQGCQEAFNACLDICKK